MLYQEAILIAISILVVSLTLYLGLNYVSGTKASLEKSGPEFSYKFPASFVHAFLYTKVSKEDVKVLNLDENKVYYVKDLIYLGDENSKKLIETKLREEYIQNMNKLSNDNGFTMHSFYKDFSSEKYEEKYLLSILYSQQTVPDLQSYVEAKNYFYYIKQKDGNYAIIFFLSQGSDTLIETNPMSQSVEAS